VQANVSFWLGAHALHKRSTEFPHPPPLKAGEYTDSKVLRAPKKKPKKEGLSHRMANFTLGLFAGKGGGDGGLRREKTTKEKHSITHSAKFKR